MGLSTQTLGSFNLILRFQHFLALKWIWRISLGRLAQIDPVIFVGLQLRMIISPQFLYKILAFLRGTHQPGQFFTFTPP